MRYVRCNRYLYPMADYADGRVCGSYTLDEDEPIYARLVEFNRQVIDAFPEKPASGALHHEVFARDDGELVFLEIAARAPAALIPQTGRIRWGVDIEQAHFRLQRGESISPPADAPGPYAGWIYYPKHTGVVADLAAPNIDSSMVWIPNVREGEHIHRSTDVRDFAAAAVVWNPDYTSLLADLKVLAEHRPLRMS